MRKHTHTKYIADISVTDRGGKTKQYEHEYCNSFSLKILYYSPVKNNDRIVNSIETHDILLSSEVLRTNNEECTALG